MLRTERTRGKVHRHHSASARETHAGGELVQNPREKLSQDFQTSSMVLVWIDGAWSGDSVSCKPLFAGGGRLKNHAIDAPRASRWETLDYRWKHDRGINDNSESCRVSVNEAARYVKDTTEQVTPVTAEVPDAADSLNIESERVKKRSGEQFFGVRDVLEQQTQKVAIARVEGRLAEEAVLTPESRGRDLPEAVAGADVARVCEGEPERSWHKDSRERGEVEDHVALTPRRSRGGVQRFTSLVWILFGDDS